MVVGNVVRQYSLDVGDIIITCVLFTILGPTVLSNAERISKVGWVLTTLSPSVGAPHFWNTV